MALENTNLAKLNIARLYKEQMKKSTFKAKSSGDWDKKAEYFSQNIVNSPYTKEFIKKVNLKNCESLLDIGSGPATISLALAKRLKNVYALDYSLEMLNYAKQRAKEQNIENLTTINKSWYDNWDDVPNADIVVASRSMEVKNIKKALEKLNSKANKRVYITAKVGGSFIDKDILEQIPRKVIPRPDYIYIVNTLHSLGIFAKVDFIQTKNSKFDCINEDEFIQSLKWSLGDLSQKEEQTLRNYFSTTYKNKEQKDSLSWAFISWEI